MSVASATTAASTRPRRDSRANNPNKVRESITPKMSHVDGLEEFQRKRRTSHRQTSGSDCCIICICLCIVLLVLAPVIAGDLGVPG